ncbi:MAG: GGDEF domain-containing protein [Gemmatimonadaceae bacterium]|nr:GGDEF domain-containing protein [Gemmatimonadaceae bacterium]
MKKLAQLLAAMDIANDSLAMYRAVIVHNLSLIGGVMLGAVGVLHVVSGPRWPLALLNFGVCAILLGNILATRYGRRTFLPFSVVAALLIAAVIGSTLLQGFNGVLWAYPTLFICFFTLPRRLALVLSVVLIVGVCAAGLERLGAGASARLFISLAFVLLMINVVLGVLGELQRALVTQAITDPLTGCYNRRHLQSYVDRMVPATEASGSGPVLLAIDIDHFKSINDRHGHDVGDAVLCRLAEVVTARQRLGDLLFRTGGEEFALLLPRSTARDAVLVAEELRAYVASSELLPGEKVTVSVGVSASALSAMRNVKDWLKSADMALYQAKHEGRDRVVLAA